MCNKKHNSTVLVLGPDFFRVRRRRNLSVIVESLKTAREPDGDNLQHLKKSAIGSRKSRDRCNRDRRSRPKSEEDPKGPCLLRPSSRMWKDQQQTRKAFVRISLAANIVILIAVCTVLIAFGTSEPVVYAWGTPTAGRGILLSIYFAILIMSILLFAMHYRSPSNAAIQYMVAALLATQIMYKVSTPITTALVREPSSAAGGANPVAISNLCISGLHAVTLFLLWRWHGATDPTSNTCACGRRAEHAHPGRS